jgi:hypothetical protein
MPLFRKSNHRHQDNRSTIDMESTASSSEQQLQLKYISEEVQRLNKAMASMQSAQEEGRQDSAPLSRPTRSPPQVIVLPIREPPSSRTNPRRPLQQPKQRQHPPPVSTLFVPRAAAATKSKQPTTKPTMLTSRPALSRPNNMLQRTQGKVQLLVPKSPTKTKKKVKRLPPPLPVSPPKAERALQGKANNPPDQKASKKTTKKVKMTTNKKESTTPEAITIASGATAVRPQPCALLADIRKTDIRKKATTKRSKVVTTSSKVTPSSSCAPKTISIPMPMVVLAQRSKLKATPTTKCNHNNNIVEQHKALVMVWPKLQETGTRDPSQKLPAIILDNSSVETKPIWPRVEETARREPSQRISATNIKTFGRREPSQCILSEKVSLNSDNYNTPSPEDDSSSSKSGGRSDPPGDNAATLFTRSYAPRAIETKTAEQKKTKTTANTVKRPAPRLAASNNRAPLDLLAGIKAGVNLKVASKSVKASKEKRTPLGSGNNPMANLLAGIKDGVNLKRVEFPKKDDAKKNPSPTSALLVKLQARKQECLRRERGSTSSVDQEEDDW